MKSLIFPSSYVITVLEGIIWFSFCLHRLYHRSWSAKVLLIGLASYSDLTSLKNFTSICDRYRLRQSYSYGNCLIPFLRPHLVSKADRFFAKKKIPSQVCKTYTGARGDLYQLSSQIRYVEDNQFLNSQNAWACPHLVATPIGCWNSQSNGFQRSSRHRHPCHTLLWASHMQCTRIEIVAIVSVTSRSKIDWYSWKPQNRLLFNFIKEYFCYV